MVAPLIVVVASAFGVACLTTYLLVRPGGRFRILDYPNERSLHSVPVPRTGGMAIVIGALAGTSVALAVLGMTAQTGWIAVAALLVGTTAFFDDVFRVPVPLRLTAQLVAAGLLVTSGLEIQSSWLVGPYIDIPAVFAPLFSVLFVVWMTNLYNFMDGMDGFAGGMAVIGFGTFGCLAWMAGSPSFMALSFVIAAAAGGFLLFNFPPARIFMGDTGSSVLGFLAGTFILWADHLELFPFWVGLLVFSPFVVDATLTLLRRLISGERVWEAHKTHYYQRLVQLGWGHRKTTLVEYSVMLLAALGAVVAVQSPLSIQWLLIVFFVAFYWTAAVIIAAMEKRAANCA